MLIPGRFARSSAFSYTTFQALPTAITGYHLASSKQNLVSMLQFSLQKKLAPQSHVHLSQSVMDFDVLCLSLRKNEANIVGTPPKTTGLSLRFWTRARMREGVACWS